MSHGNAGRFRPGEEKKVSMFSYEANPKYIFWFPLIQSIDGGAWLAACECPPASNCNAGRDSMACLCMLVVALIVVVDG